MNNKERRPDNGRKTEVSVGLTLTGAVRGRIQFQVLNIVFVYI